MDLERIYKKPVDLLIWQDIVSDIYDLSTTINQVDVVAVDLPIKLLSGVLKMVKDKPVIKPLTSMDLVSCRLTHGGVEDLVLTPQHICWQQVLEATLETKDL